MILSILIPTKKANKPDLDILLSILLPQLEGLNGKVEVLLETDDKLSNGYKLNSMLKDADGEYIWILNDSDLVSESAVSDILSATGSDIISICGATSKDKPEDWVSGLAHEIKFTINTPFKKVLAPKFKPKSARAESVWVKDFLKNKGLTESVISKPIIHKRK